MQLSTEHGLLLAPQPGSQRALVSGLLLRLDALAAADLLSREQGALLRNLAWQQDVGLLRAYEQVRSDGEGLGFRWGWRGRGGKDEGSTR